MSKGFEAGLSEAMSNRHAKATEGYEDMFKEEDDAVAEPKYNIGDVFVFKYTPKSAEFRVVQIDEPLGGQGEGERERVYTVNHSTTNEVTFLFESELDNDYELIESIDQQYKHGNIEPLDVMKEQGWFEGFCRGNIIKYTMRRKGSDLDDLKKVVDYAERLIDWYKENEPSTQN